VIGFHCDEALVYLLCCAGNPSAVNSPLHPGLMACSANALVAASMTQQAMFSTGGSSDHGLWTVLRCATVLAALVHAHECPYLCAH
jgi:hypothetical protein